MLDLAQSRAFAVPGTRALLAPAASSPRGRATIPVTSIRRTPPTRCSIQSVASKRSARVMACLPALRRYSFRCANCTIASTVCGVSKPERQADRSIGRVFPSLTWWKNDGVSTEDPGGDAPVPPGLLAPLFAFRIANANAQRKRPPTAFQRCPRTFRRRKPTGPRRAIARYVAARAKFSCGGTPSRNALAPRFRAEERLSNISGRLLDA